MAENVKRKKKKRAVLIVLMALVLAVLAVVCVYETELNKLDSNDGVDNSFYDSQFKNKKVMVIVPHEDDDLLISGQVLPSMYKNGADVRVVFATNGDKRVSAYTRQSEACNALEKLGIPREKVIFLGYPDGTQLFCRHRAAFRRYTERESNISRISRRNAALCRQKSLFFLFRTGSYLCGKGI